MSYTHVVVNMAFQLGNNAQLLEFACADADVISVVEALEDGGKRAMDLRKILPPGWATNQDLSSPAKAGSAVCWREDTMELVASAEPKEMSPAGRGVRARYLSAALLKERTTGDVRNRWAAHAPRKITGKQGIFYRNLSAWLSHHPLAVGGGDGNANLKRLPGRIGRKVYGYEVMYLAGSRDLIITVSRLNHPASDHPLVRAAVGTLPKKRKPAPMAAPKPAPKKEVRPVPTSENGWPVIFDKQKSLLRKTIIPGANRHFYFRDGAVALVLAHYLLWFHETIERIDLGQWDEWGWAVRPVRGKTSGYSNHASGTAFDVNALKHVLGKRGTFKPWQYTKIRARLAFYRGCIRLGLDYKTRVDEMHGEINKPPAAVKLLALFLLTTPRGKRLLAANPGLESAVHAS